MYDTLYTNVIFGIRKRVFKIRDFLNNFINKAPQTDFAKIQVTCCEQLNQNNTLYILYFRDIDENIIKMTTETTKLQTRYFMLNNLFNNNTISIFHQLSIP